LTNFLDFNQLKIHVVVAVTITSDYLQLRAFPAAVGIACGTRSTCACLPAAVR